MKPLIKPLIYLAALFFTASVSAASLYGTWEWDRNECRDPSLNPGTTKPDEDGHQVIAHYDLTLNPDKTFSVDASYVNPDLGAGRIVYKKSGTYVPGESNASDKVAVIFGGGGLRWQNSFVIFHLTGNTLFTYHLDKQDDQNNAFCDGKAQHFVRVFRRSGG